MWVYEYCTVFVVTSEKRVSVFCCVASLVLNVNRIRKRIGNQSHSSIWPQKYPSRFICSLKKIPVQINGKVHRYHALLSSPCCSLCAWAAGLNTCLGVDQTGSENLDTIIRTYKITLESTQYTPNPHHSTLARALRDRSKWARCSRSLAFESRAVWCFWNWNWGGETSRAEANVCSTRR